MSTQTLGQTITGHQDDLAGIITAYTEVTERLGASHDRLMAEVARLREELADKNEQLQRRNRLAALGQMAAGMAHEIRNPLGGISLYAGLLGKQLADRPESAKLAGRIGSAVERLNVIVRDILAFAGEIRPQVRPTLLATVFDQACQVAQGRLEMSGTRLTRRCDGDREFSADPSLLARALSNLLFNASDAAGQGEVLLAGSVGPRKVRITVADSGPGIDPETAPKIVNPFFTTKDVGTGLGLAIVHRIIESHNGQITVATVDKPKGLGGAMFTIDLPLEQKGSIQ